jgi:hypothetical protein
VKRSEERRREREGGEDKVGWRRERRELKIFELLKGK